MEYKLKKQNNNSYKKIENALKFYTIVIGISFIFVLIISLNVKGDIFFSEDFETWDLDSDDDEAPVGWEMSWKYKILNTYGGKTYWHNSTQTPLSSNCAKVNFNNKYDWSQDERLISPTIDLTNCNNTNLIFWTESYGNNYPMGDHDYVQVRIEGDSWTTIIDLAQQVPTNLWDSPITLNISSYDNEIIQLRFRKYNQGYQWNKYVGVWAIDNLTVEADYEALEDSEPPVTTLDLVGPHTGDYISSKTRIWLNATDYPMPGASGVNYTEYQIWYKDTWGPIKKYIENFNLTEDCIHRIRFHSVDLAGNVEDWTFHTLYVDNAAPTSWLEVGEPKWGEYITSDTLIKIHAEDTGKCSVSDIFPPKINYSIDNGNSWIMIDFSGNASIGWYINFYFNSDVDLIWYVIDGLANGAKNKDGSGGFSFYDIDFSIVSDIDIVSQTSGKYYVDGYGGIHVTKGSTFEIGEHWDPFIGFAGFRIIYRIWWEGDKTWTPWIYGPWNVTPIEIKLNEECKHYIEFYAIDTSGNNESEPNWENLHNVTLYVDNSPPFTTDEVADARWYDPYENLWVVTFPTTVWLNSSDFPAGECAVGCNFTWYEIWYDSDGDTMVDSYLTSGVVDSVYGFGPRPEVYINISLTDKTFYRIQWYSVDYLDHYEIQQERFLGFYEEPEYYEGLTPGFWKNHHDDWEDYTSSMKIGDVFILPSSLEELNVTLGSALCFKGGEGVEGAARILLRQAVAGLLNSAHHLIDYPMFQFELIPDVNTALASGDRVQMLILKDMLDEYNNLGCEDL